MSKQDDLYKQVKMVDAETESNYQVCWIPEYLAKENKVVHLKVDNIKAKIIDVFEHSQPLKVIEINRYHPLKDATDI